MAVMLCIKAGMEQAFTMSNPASANAIATEHVTVTGDFVRQQGRVYVSSDCLCPSGCGFFLSDARAAMVRGSL